MRDHDERRTQDVRVSGMHQRFVSSIELLSSEKASTRHRCGAVEEAIALATRKYYKTRKTCAGN